MPPTITPPETIRYFERVPDGSVLSLTVSPPAGAFTSHATLAATASPEQSWADAAIRPGSQQAILQQGKAYIVTVWLTFLAAATATVTITITRPDQVTHSKPHQWTVTGNNGDVVRLDDIIRMA